MFGKINQLLALQVVDDGSGALLVYLQGLPIGGVRPPKSIQRIDNIFAYLRQCSFAIFFSLRLHLEQLVGHRGQHLAALELQSVEALVVVEAPIAPHAQLLAEQNHLGEFGVVLKHELAAALSPMYWLVCEPRFCGTHSAPNKPEKGVGKMAIKLTCNWLPVRQVAQHHGRIQRREIKVVDWTRNHACLKQLDAPAEV